ncbi:MAG: putative Ig domain-containing protein, partial [Actinobacteria bacterium]|nr:putative Ig domain-containing protein [Actinomycetota bacterium]
GNTAPVVTSATIDQTTPKTSDILTVTVSASDAEGDPLTYSYQWNKNGIALTGQTNATLDLSLAGNGDRGDAISVRVTASDGVALGVKTSPQVTIVNSPPVFNQDLANRTDPEGQAVTFPAAATDNDGDLLAYQAAGLPPGVSIDPATGQIAGTISSGAAASSPYNVSVTVQDNGTAPAPAPIALVQKKSGDQSATVGNTMSLTFDAPPTEGNLLVAFGHASSNRTPTIPAGWSLAVETGSSAETVVFYKVAGATEPSTVSFSMSGADLFMGLAIFEYRGLHNVQSEVLDRTVFGSASSVSSVSTGTTQPTNVADELLVASMSLNSTRIFSNAWANSFERQTVDRRQSVAHRVVSATGQFQTQESWDSAAGAATGTLVTFKRASGPSGNPNPGSATDSFTWSISPPGGGGANNQAPVVNSVGITPESPRTNDSLTAQVDASDPDGDPLTLAYQWIKNGTDIAGATGAMLDLSVAGYGGKGDILSVRATARDASTTSAPVTSAGVTVVNSLPVFGQDLGDRTSTQGDTVSVSAAATDADGDSLTYGATSLPSGLSIDSSTGLISGTIAAGAATNSPYAVAITVSDAAGNAVDGFSWTILVPPTAPTGLVATPTTTSTVLSWGASSQPNLAGYNVYRSASQIGPFTKLNGSPLTLTSFDDTAAPRGTSYYRVTAVNTAGGESSPAETSATRKIVLRSVSTRSVKDASSVTINKPSGIVAGDVMVAGLDVLGTPTITAPTGWSLVRADTDGTAMRQAIYYKVATSSEPRTYKWTFSARRSTAVVIAAYQGAASVVAIDAHDGQANPASTSISAPGVSTSMPDAVLVGFFGMV